MAQEIDVQLGEPVVVARSEPSERRWGFHQFPKLARLPDRRLLLTFNASADDDLHYGQPGPAHVSADDGRTWRPFDHTRDGDAGITVSHSPLSEVFDGEHLCAPFSRALKVVDHALPPPLGRWTHYNEVTLHAFDACPPEVQRYHTHLPALRWTRRHGWQYDHIAYDTRDLLVRASAGGIARSSFQYPLLRHNGALLYPEYVHNYHWPRHAVPPRMATHLMVSLDNGRSFTRRSIVFHDPHDVDSFGEAALAADTRGGLVCVVRRSMPDQKPLAITHSTDLGHTWEPHRPLHTFGVLPNLLMLGNNVMALSFGRPGVWLSFSPDGMGRRWTTPTPVIAGDHGRIMDHSCGYTAMVALADDRLLLAYTDFNHTHGGTRHKAILVREVRVRRVTPSA